MTAVDPSGCYSLLLLFIVLFQGLKYQDKFTNVKILTFHLYFSVKNNLIIITIGLTVLENKEDKSKAKERQIKKNPIK